MSIDDYLNGREVKLSELQEHFTEVGRSDPYNADTTCCPACGDKRNLLTSIPSEPWTYSMYCASCDSLILIIWGDKMGGGFDTMLVFKEKK